MYQKRNTPASRPDRNSRFGGGFGGNTSGRRHVGNSGPQRHHVKRDYDFARFVKKAEHEDVGSYQAEHSFTDFPIDPRLHANVAGRGFHTPTPVQDEAIMPLLRGYDIVGLAETGTGKTGAFLLPMIDKVIKDSKNRVLIVVPTRELAEQIQVEFRSFAAGLRIYSTLCIGGAGIFRQISDLRRRPQFVIGTPGRLKDLYERNVLPLEQFSNVVLDEADRMLDMGFVQDITYLVSKTAEPRQTMFFSATMNREAELIVGKFLKDPVRINIGKRDTSKNVEQDVVRLVGGQNKVDVLHDLLIKEDFTKVLVFSRTKRGAESLSNDLQGRGFKVESIHGDKTQAKRSQALRAFRSHSINILVATDVAARGIDVPDISHVINYDVPDTYDDYIHRIGRTGRGDKKGKALTFVR